MPIRRQLKALKFAVEFVSENCDQSLTLKDVAAAAAVHPVYLGEIRAPGILRVCNMKLSRWIPIIYRFRRETVRFGRHATSFVSYWS